MSQPWWNQLPVDYYRRFEPTEIDREHRLKVAGTAVADRVLRTGLGALVSAAMVPPMATSAAVARQRRQLAWYQPHASGAERDQVFVPPAPTAIESLPRGRFEWRPDGIPARRLRFRSGFEPLHPELRPAWRKAGRNAVSEALYLSHDDGPRPTLIWVHGYTLDSYRINAGGFSLPWLWKKGYDILQVTLPFHGVRAERWHPFSGYGCFAHGFAGFNESMLQAVHDLRVWLGWLLARGAPKVGISGLSLGGYVTAMMASVEPRLAFAIPNSPLVAPIDMALQWQPLGPLLRVLDWRDGVGIAELRHGLALHSPLSWMPLLDPGRLLIISGAGDRFTSPDMVRLLHRHWNGSRLHWFPGNHVLHFQQAHYLRLMKRFMDEACARG
jgi:hypothetical protein